MELHLISKTDFFSTCLILKQTYWKYILDSSRRYQRKGAWIWQFATENLSSSAGIGLHYPKLSPSSWNPHQNSQRMFSRPFWGIFSPTATLTRLHLYLQDRFNRNQLGSDRINELCSSLEVYNNWTTTIQQRAATDHASIAVYLGSEPDSQVQKGQACVSSLTVSVDNLLRDCREFAMEEVCPLATACSFSRELLSDLSSAWQSMKEDLPLARQKSQSEAMALADFHAACGDLKSWLAEVVPEVERIGRDIEKFNQGDLPEDEEIWPSVGGRLPESVTRCLNLCVERKEKLVSESTAMVHKINVSVR